MAASPHLLLSRRSAWLDASPIREILAVTERPGMISFAGGLPAPECFPEPTLAGLPAAALQYGASEGDMSLREQVAAELGARGLACPPQQILILSGSQQGIDLTAKLFVDPGTCVALESPTYLAALQVFRFFGARFLAFDRSNPAASLGGPSRPAFLYAIPTFQNPTGHCYSRAEREALARSCDAQAVPLFEDDPYRDLAYDECERTPACALLERASWIYQGSFSKSLAPGLRLGYLAASPDLMPYLIRLKQAADLHSSRISQWFVLQQLQDPRRPQRIAEVVATYRDKRDRFAASLARHFGGLARWQVPAGGLFYWLQLQARVDTRPLLDQAIERGVAFMPGEFFFPEPASATGHLRLNFSLATPEQSETGLARLAQLLREQS